MKMLLASVLLASASVSPVLADPPQPSTDPAVVESIKGVEIALGDAMVAVDMDALGQNYADDFAGIGSSGKAYGKEELLNDFRTGDHKLVSYENGPMDVQVFGDVAVVHGSTSEVRFDHGKNADGVFVWMDLLRKIGGRWVIARTVGARVK